MDAGASKPNAEIITCFLYLRKETENGYRYDSADTWTTCHPPSVGDMVHAEKGTVRIVARAWGWPRAGSRTHLEHVTQGAALRVSLDLVAEQCEGPFANEDPDDEVEE